MYVCLLLDMYDKGSEGNAKIPRLKLPATSFDEAKARTSHEDITVKALRRASKNTLELVATVLADTQMYFAVCLIDAVVRPLRELQTEQSTKMRCAAGVLEWYTKASLGEGFGAIKRFVAVLLDVDVLADLGMKGAVPASRDIDDVIVVEEDHKAAILGAFIMSLMRKRLATEFWHTRGLPGIFAGLLDAGESERILKYIKKQWERWQRFQEKKRRFVREGEETLRVQVCVRGKSDRPAG